MKVSVLSGENTGDRRRARYHSSIIDSRLLRHGDDFSDLPESYVIFITERDVIGGKLPIYIVERQITNTGENFNDGEHIIYVNGEAKNNATELGRLMHDFFCTDPDEMHYKQLADKVRYFKQDEKGVETMCRVMEEMRNSAKDEVRIESAKKMLKDGVSIEKTAEYSGLSVDKIKEIMNEMLVIA